MPYDSWDHPDIPGVRMSSSKGWVMTLPEAAALLGVTAATLRQQIANGKLHARKVGRDWTVSSREVERYRVRSSRAAQEKGETGS
jgi:excisionase family DNA binding protein